MRSQAFKSQINDELNDSELNCSSVEDENYQEVPQKR